MPSSDSGFLSGSVRKHTTLEVGFLITSLWYNEEHVTNMIQNNTESWLASCRRMQEVPLLRAAAPEAFFSAAMVLTKSAYLFLFFLPLLELDLEHELGQQPRQSGKDSCSANAMTKAKI